MRYKFAESDKKEQTKSNKIKSNYDKNRKNMTDRCHVWYDTI